MDAGFMGDGRGETPESEISVLVDSAPGEAAAFFQPKKEVILAPGVLGADLWSLEVAGKSSEPESTRNGGGRDDDDDDDVVVVVGRGGCRGACRDIVVVVAERWCVLALGLLAGEAAPGSAETTGSLARRGRKAQSRKPASARPFGRDPWRTGADRREEERGGLRVLL